MREEYSGSYTCTAKSKTGDPKEVKTRYFVTRAELAREFVMHPQISDQKIKTVSTNNNECIFYGVMC